MGKQIAVILAGATLALGFGGYLLSGSMGAYDLDKSAKDVAARIERLETEKTENTGILSSLLDSYETKMETARKTFQGEYFPPTPKGWVIKKTDHGEVVDFARKNKLTMNVNSNGSIRRFTAWSSQHIARTADVAYRKGDKVIFLRLTFANVPRKTELGISLSWLFDGVALQGEDVTLAGATFETRRYKKSNVINIAAKTGFYTGIGVLSNASMEEVESLLTSMDLYEFASQTGHPDGGTVIPFFPRGGGGLEPMSTNSNDTTNGEIAALKAAQKPAQQENLIAEADTKEEEAIEVASESADTKERKNLLSTFLAEMKTQKQKQHPTGKTKGSKESMFQTVGSFTSKCKTGGGAKVCSIQN